MIEQDGGNKWYDLVARAFALGWKGMMKTIFLLPALFVIYKICNLEVVIIALLFIYVLSRFVLEMIYRKMKEYIKSNYTMFKIHRR